MSENVIKAIAATAEVMGRELSPDALQMFYRQLSKFPEPMVLRALERTYTEVKGNLSLGDVMLRLDDGRPTVEEAWAMVPKNELDSVVWTQEMAEAHSVAAPLIASDEVAARMAFREVYNREVLKARAAARPPKWWASFGHDSRGRDTVIRMAVEKGRLPAPYAAALIGAPVEEIALLAPPEQHQALADETHR
jgi:hypothetical protein